MSAQEAMSKLEEYANELDERSLELAAVQRELEPMVEQYDDFIADFETGLWEAHDKEGAKLPSEALRLQLARKAMPSGFLTNYRTLVARRDRLKKRIGDLKASASAQQSVLSALKVELEALR